MVWKKVLLISALFVSIVAFASKESNSTTKIDSGDKIVLLYVDDNACRYCRELDMMLQEGKAKELIDKHFIIRRVMLNEDLYLPEGLPPPFGTPTVYFLDQNEEALIEPMRGEKTKEDLILFLEEAIREKRQQDGNASGNSFWDKLFGK